MNGELLSHDCKLVFNGTSNMAGALKGLIAPLIWTLKGPPGMGESALACKMLVEPGPDILRFLPPGPDPNHDKTTTKPRQK